MKALANASGLGRWFSKPSKEPSVRLPVEIKSKAPVLKEPSDDEWVLLSSDEEI